MSKLHKTITYIDEQQDSKYFHIEDIPSIFSSGINSFKLKIDASVFKQGQKILVQIVDSAGNIIPTRYYDVTINFYRLITIYISDQVINGYGYIRVVGTLVNVPQQ